MSGFKQTKSPVVPMIPVEKLRALPAAAAVQLLNDRELIIRQMEIGTEEGDPFHHCYDPARWRKIDLAVARKRLENPGTVIELIVLGGHDSGKTNGAVLRLVRHFFYTHKAWCWGLHSTETSSQEIHQERVFDLSPLKLRRSLNERGGARGSRKVALKFTHGKGFTNNRFTWHWPVKLPGHREPMMAGGMMAFKFFESKVQNMQGSKLTCANSDELVSEAMAKTVRQRMVPRATLTAEPEFLHEIRECVRILESGKQLPPHLQGLLYTSVHIMGFTPIDGYSPFVAGVLEGAVATENEEAWIEVPMEMAVPECFPTVELGVQRGMKRVHLLPQRDKHGKLLGSKLVPVFKQPKNRGQLVAYLPTTANPYTNVAGKLMEMEGQNEVYIRQTFFGDVGKSWSTKFPKFSLALMPHGHVFETKDLPKDGTWYFFADFATGRNFFMAWVLVDPQERKWIAREWPMEGDYIPEDDWGDPGAWAVVSKLGKRDGDPGPASPDRGLGLAAYKREMDRVERELGEEWSGDRSPIVVEQRQGDSRLGNNPTKTEAGSTSIIDEFTKEDVWFDPMSGKCLSDGDALINDALDWDASKPMGPRNSPKLLVHQRCKAILFALANYSGVDGPKAACKDPRDVVAGMMLGELRYLGGETLQVRVGKGRRA